ncbi:hypothetical protein [Fusobacterium sp. PH5-44]|uniref:hypothetical protein n=1 Tax=unclassified Fusobacterium TaxID=2648384 RepID=UPI003D1A41FB
MRIPLDKIEAIAKAYNVTPEYLCGWKDEIEISKSTNKMIQGFKDIGQGILTSWHGLTTGLVVSLFTGSTAIGGVSAIGIITLYLFLIYDGSKDQKNKYIKKFRKRKLLVPLQVIFTETDIYKKFRSNCFFAVNLKDEIENWKHKLLDLLLKTFYFIAHLIREDKIDDFIQPNELYENDSIEIIEDFFDENNSEETEL